MVEFVSQLIVALFATPIANFFAWAIVIVFGAALVILFGESREEKKSRGHALVRPVPVILTSLGILGTFSGVFFGLQDFDINDTTASFPTLLEGLKVAFSTSIFGLFLAVVFRVLMEYKAHKEGSGDIDGQDLYNLIEEGVAATREATGAFKSFADDMAKANKEQILEALKEVINEFNRALTAQVGESFKELARAVDRLVEWQENYKRQMEEMKRSLEVSIEGIAKAELSLSRIAVSLETVPENIATVSDIIRTAQTQLENLDRHLRAFAEMRDKASDVFPEIQRNMESLTAGLRKTVEDQVKVLDEIIKSQKISSEQMRTGAEQMKASAESALKEIEAATTSGMSAMSGALQKAADEFETAQRRSMSEMQDSLKRVTDDMTANMKAAVDVLDDATKHQIETTMRGFSGYVSGIMERVVQVSQPLVDASRSGPGADEERRG